MVQYRKREVEAAILDAAREVFAARGYASATMQDIARAAGISIGNVYRYYPSKEALFDAVVPPEFVRRYERLLRRRVASLAGGDDPERLPADAPYQRASRELLAFCLEHRRAVVILLGRAEGSRYQGFAARIARLLVALALRHFRALRPVQRLTPALRFNLEHIYGNLLRVMVDALAEHRDERLIAEIVAGYSRYHLAGLAKLFA